MAFIGTQSTDQQLINNFYVTGHESYRIPRNNAKKWPLRRSRSFKLTNFSSNRNFIYDFLLVINTNLPPILAPFSKIWLITCQIIASDRCCFTLTPSLGVIPANIAISDIPQKLASSGYILLAECIGVSSTTFTFAFGEIT